ncbi:MAG: heavy-metal-associated domain-containing protein, partial [Acidobacteriota bacterium]
MKSLRSKIARSFSILSLVSLSLFSSACASPSKTSDAHDHAAATQPTDTLTVEQRFEGLHVAQLEVLGMSCPLCAHNISQQLEKIPAVKKTHIDLGTGIVSAGLAPDEAWPSVDELKAAVDKAGYTVGKV